MTKTLVKKNVTEIFNRYTKLEGGGRFVASGSWEIPLAAQAHGIERALLHGWQANGIMGRGTSDVGCL